VTRFHWIISSVQESTSGRVCSEHCPQTDCGPYFTSRIVIAVLVAKKLCGVSLKPNQWVGITALVRVLRLGSR
jgi:hypothetical protein